MMEALKFSMHSTNSSRSSKMKMLSLLAISLTAFSAFAQTYNVVPSGSKIVYVGKKVTGEHTGTLTLKNGSLTLKGDEITAGELVADMNSLTSTDITDKDYNAKYVSHMKSADFFNTEKFPESKLVIKSSKKTDKGILVQGELTMLGVTKPVSFVVSDLKKTETEVSGKSNLTLNRTTWGLKYGSANFFKNLGDKAINDEFTLSVELFAKK
jgi:polyisoprenoid-binding protein YceI